MLSTPSSPARQGATAVRRHRFVAVCQQLLALALVLAVLTPAARTVTMEVRPPDPGDVVGSGTAYLRAARVPATVPTTAVDPKVKEYSLTAPKGARLAPGALRATARRTTGAGQRLVSDPVPVVGSGMVGVTWQHGVHLEDDALAVEARSYAGGAWSDWTEVPYHDEHGPDPDSREARRARPGTDALLVGEVDQVQVKIETAQAAPADLRLAVIDPGEATSTARQLPDIDTSTDGDTTDDGTTDDGTTDDGTTDDGELELQGGVVAPKPQIFSRAQWGADERMRDRGSLHYYEVHAGFVHHTVNANNYTRAQVPGIIRSIYAYHTRSQGWSDIGYNFLVDRFGRIWEGRYGGVDRPVVGAHTLGYNDNSFAMSAIGNFETARPTSAMIQAYGALFAWKLGLHGVNAADTRQYVSSRYFPAINGHRDAGSTACPGRFLYSRLGGIRTLAADTQRRWAGRDLESNLIQGARPDLVFRRASDGRAVIRQIQYRNGSYRLGKPQRTGLNLSSATAILRVGDWDRDGKGDLVVRHDGALWLHRGLGGGRFARETRLATGFSHVRQLAAVGDFTGDGRPDLMGQPRRGSMTIYPGNGAAGLKRSFRAYSPIAARQQIGIGRWDGDGASDTIVRTDTALVVYYGNGPGGLTGRRALPTGISTYDWMIGIDDVDVTGHSDLIARGRKTGLLWLFQGTTGGLRPRVPITGPTTQYDLVG